MPVPGHERARAGAAGHAVAERGGIGQRGRDDVARRDLDALHAQRLRRVEPEQGERPEHADELLAEAVLERHALAVDPARHQHDLLVLDVDALDRADAGRELEQLGLGERRGRVPAALALPDQRRVQALLDRRPDRERGRERVAVDREVGAVAHADLVDALEQVVGGVAGEDVGEPRLDADPAEREPARAPPTRRATANCSSPSITPGCSKGRSGWRCESVIAMSR